MKTPSGKQGKRTLKTKARESTPASVRISLDELAALEESARKSALKRFKKLNSQGRPRPTGGTAMRIRERLKNLSRSKLARQIFEHLRHDPAVGPRLHRLALANDLDDDPRGVRRLIERTLAVIEVTGGSNLVELTTLSILRHELRLQDDFLEALSRYERKLVSLEKNFLPIAAESDRGKVQPPLLLRGPGQKGGTPQVSTGLQTEGFLSDAIPFRELNLKQIAAVMKRGKERPWGRRTVRGVAYQADVFEYVRKNYREWIPGLTQELLGQADPSIISYYKKRKSEAGLPSWLAIPTRTEARDLMETDPKRAAWRELERARHRERRAALKGAELK